MARTNTNLGILLLLAPLASVAPGEPLPAGLSCVLDTLSVADARAAYEAIRLANPSGLGHVAEQDVAEEPTQTLRQVMALAADRDLIAMQYVNGFAQVFKEGVPALRYALDRGALEGAVIACQLHLLARHPDSLIIRKRGPEEAAEVSRRAAQVTRPAGMQEKCLRGSTPGCARKATAATRAPLPTWWRHVCSLPCARGGCRRWQLLASGASCENAPLASNAVYSLLAWRGLILMLRKATGPWFPWNISGPAGTSLPVRPPGVWLFISTLSWITASLSVTLRKRALATFLPSLKRGAGSP